MWHLVVEEDMRPFDSRIKQLCIEFEKVKQIEVTTLPSLIFASACG